MTPAEYYDNPDVQGNYQYVPLEEIINNFMMSRDADDYTATVPRYKILYQAKRGLQELYYDVLRDIRALSLTVSPLLTIVLPPDYINYVRISWVDSEGILHPMAVNSNKTFADTYLQDHAYKILFDNEGCVLKDSSIVPTDGRDSDDKKLHNHCFSDIGFKPNTNLSNVYSNGSFVIDNRGGVIQFSSEIASKNIVLEYISDGLYMGCGGTDEEKITIHKFAEKALNDFMYFELINQRRNVPFNEKQRARKEYYNSRRVAKRRINTLRRAEILQAFKG